MPSILGDDEQAEFWSSLGEFLQQDKLVPVAGVELLELEDGSNFYTRVAEEFARKERLPAPTKHGSRALSEVASGMRWTNRLLTAKLVIRELQKKLPMPRALLDLAALPARLFVSTTPDALLAQAIEQQHGRVNVVSYSPDKPQQFTGMPRNGAPTVFQLFGSADGTDLVVTEDDLLEFMLALQSVSGSPERLLLELRKKNLLFVGCGFPDWLARFFIRFGRAERFSSETARTAWMVDSAAADTELVAFFDQLRGCIRCFPQPVSVFAERLRANLTSPLTPMAVDELRGTVFVSYANEDREFVKLLCETLGNNGVDCWFDREQLQLGDAWEQKIMLGIERCAFFMPIISRQVLTNEWRFFRKEWTQAEEVSRGYRADRTFILPVYIDDTPLSDERLDESIRSRHGMRICSASELPKEFILAVTTAFKQSQLDARSSGPRV